MGIKLASARPDGELFEHAKSEARRLHRPVYIAGGEVHSDRPPRTTAMVWPNGSVTWGNPQAASKQIDRRHLPPAA
ncbi:MAG TPA: hypothetical protein VEK76_04685 [Candidatus Binatia bacterium]|nr:hypothetical protein [Candidatus Binatia bacterium]